MAKPHLLENRAPPGPGIGPGRTLNGRAHASAASAASVDPTVACARSGNAEISDADWDLLFGAVQAQLRGLASAGQGTARRELEVTEGRLRMHAGITQCVAALDQLHAALNDEQARHRQLRATLVEAEMNLVRLLAQPAGTQAEEVRAPFGAARWADLAPSSRVA